MRLLSRAGIGLRLSLWTTLAVCLVLLVFTAMAWRQSAASFESQSRNSLSTATAVMHQTLSLYHGSLSDSVQRLTGSLAAQLPAGPFSVEIRESNHPALPALRAGNHLLGSDNALLDRFTADTGAVATVFVRQGNDFVRVGTSLHNQHGERVIGSTLGTTHPAHDLLLSGRSYTGPATLFGQHYMTHYRPLRDTQGETVGILFVGLDYSQGLAALTDSLRRQRLGRDGYFFVVGHAADGSASLLVHPVHEGRPVASLAGGKDRAMLDTLLSQPGQMQLQLDHGLPDSTPHAHATSIRFDPWGWTLVGVQPDTELQASQMQLLMMLCLLGAAALVLIVLVLVYSSRRLVARPLQSAVRVAGEVARGQLDTPVPTGQAGEIGTLMQALQAMRDDLRQRQETERQTAEAILRVRLSLDSTASGTLVTDTHWRIVYANPAFQSLLDNHRLALEPVLPRLRWDQPLEGQPLSALECDGNLPEEIVHQLQTHRSVTTRTSLGAVSIERDIACVQDRDGQVVGYVTQWRDRTAETRVEAQVAKALRAAAQGDLEQRLDTEGLEGFHRQLAEQINQLLHTNARTLVQLADVLRSIACGDLDVHMDGDHQGLYARMRDDANATVRTLAGIVERIQQASLAIDQAASEIATGNQELSRRTEQQAASLEETAASMEELTATVRHNADNALQADRLAAHAAHVATEGGTVVGQVVQTMQGIEDASRRIADIIGLIDSIAFQTNILALNAAVEAARAGDQGRGFAVVASEVRALAQRSATAAREIKTLIDDSVEQVASGSALVHQAGTTMNGIVDSIRQVASLMAGIRQASQEQSAGIAQVNQTIVQMDTATQQNAALVEEANAAAQAMAGQSSDLSEAVRRFRLHGRSDGSLQAPAGR